MSSYFNSPGHSSIHLFGGSHFIGAPKFVHMALVADKVLQKFSRWKDNALSLAGRKCLINNVIVGSLVHTMMIYK